MQSNLLIENHATPAINSEGKSLALVAERSRALLSDLDHSEALVEPIAGFWIVADRLALLSMRDAADTLLQSESQMIKLEQGQFHDMAAEPLVTLLSAAENALAQFVNFKDIISTVQVGSTNPNVKALADDLLQSLSRMFDRLEAVRWTILEREADIDIERGHVRKFGNPDAAIAYLHRLVR